MELRIVTGRSSAGEEVVERAEVIDGVGHTIRTVHVTPHLAEKTLRGMLGLCREAADAASARLAAKGQPGVGV